MAEAVNLTQCTKIPRFSEDVNLRVFHFDVLQDCGHLSVSGNSNKGKVTFIDLFKITNIGHGGDKPLLKNSKPFYSIKPSSSGSDNRRTTCMLDDNHFVTCSMNIIQIYNTGDDSVEKEAELGGKPNCMAISDNTIYVALSSSQVAMFDFNLHPEKTIKLRGKYFSNPPLDIAVLKRRLFVCSSKGAVSMYTIEGHLELVYRQANIEYNVALSVTVSEKRGLLFVLWGVGSYVGQVSIYSPRLVAVYSPFEGHFRAAFSVATDSWKVKVCDKDDRLFVVTSRSGEVYAYNVSDIFTFDNTVRSLGFVLEKVECLKLARYFKIPLEKSNAIISNHSTSSSLLKYLREKKKIAEDDVANFMTACCQEGLIKSAEVLIHYQHFQYQRVKSQLERASDADEESD